MENISVGLISVCIVLQVGVLTALFVSIRKLSHDIERLRTHVDKEVAPALSDFVSVLSQTREILGSIRTTAENFASISGTVKNQVQRVNLVIEETTDRARIQISKADEVVADAIDKMQATSAIVQENILAPIREVSAIVRGVSSGLQFLFARRKNAVDRVHQDEELFI